MKIRFVPVVALLSALVALGGCGGNGRNSIPGHLKVSGNVEITDAEMSFKLAGKVSRRVVNEGELVKAGDVVATLECADLEVAVAQAQAEVAAAAAYLAALEAGSRPEEIEQAAAAAGRARAALEDLQAGSRPQELAQAEAAVRAAQAEAERADLEYDRAKAMFEKKVQAKREFDAAVSTRENAASRLREARESLSLAREGARVKQIEQAARTLAEAEARYTLVRKGPRQEDKDQARARLAQAKANLAMAQTRLGYAVIRSPFGGVVMSQNIETGEYVSLGTPVVTVGDLAHPWIRVYVDETEIGRVKPGMKLKVRTDSLPNKDFLGTVTFISSEAEFTPKVVQTDKERVKLVYRIKVLIDNPGLELKPGMPADAFIPQR